MASINDVAQKAQVAKSTVSLVINNSGYVSKRTREKVEKAMQELNYVPSQLARNFSTAKSNIVGIVMPDVVHPFFSTFIKHAEEKLYEKGYMTMVCGTVGREKVEEKYLDMLNRRVMDGIIMGVHSLDVEKYKETTRPIVTIDRYLDESIPMIRSDHRKAAEIAAQLVKENNCKEVVHLTGSMVVDISSNEYYKHSKELLEELGIKVHRLVIGSNSFSLTDYENAAQKVFELYPNTDCILGVDMAILACMKEASTRGYEVPKDLKLIAYDGTYVTRLVDKAITSIKQPIDLLAEEAVNTIVALIEEQEVENLNVVLDVSLQQGETTIIE